MRPGLGQFHFDQDAFSLAILDAFWVGVMVVG
jgi:hypothetical protein